MRERTHAFGAFEIDGPRLQLRRAGAVVRVEPKVLDLLLLLVHLRDRVVLRDEILQALWNDVVVSDASIWRVVMQARRAIGDDAQRVIVTVRGRGFRFAGDVVELRKPVARPDVAAPSSKGEPDPTLFGREACLSAIVVRLGQALAGKGGAVWLSGEAGIGKTRVLEEAVRRARRAAVSVLVAHAYETPQMPAFWPWAEAVRALAAERGAVRCRELLAAAAPALEARDPTSGAARFALFDGTTRALADLARERPMVLVFDDLHCADEPSLALLEFLGRQVRRHAVLLLGAYRDAGLARDARARALGGLIGQPRALHVPLRRLALDDVARLAAASCGIPPSPALAEVLLDRSGGNPLYLEQLLKTEWAERALTGRAAELASTMDLQQGLIETIGRHLDTMSNAGSDLLTLAAVLGNTFHEAQLGVVSGLPSTELLDRLDEAVKASLLLRSGPGSYRFTHLLVRDVLHKRLSSAQRSALHLAAGERLLAHYADAMDAHAPQLAHHFCRALPAGDPARAVDLAIRAAEQLGTRGKPAAALRHWRQAARACTLLPGLDLRRVPVQLGLARGLLAAGEPCLARDAFLDAAILATSFGQSEARAEAALAYAPLAADAPDQRRAILEGARDALDEDGGSPATLRARIAALLP